MSLPLDVRLRRWAYRAGYAGLEVWWFLRRPDTHGVKLVIRDGDAALFVRHTYGPPVWELPGGGRRRGESAAAAATREAQEELGLEIEDWTEFGLVVATDRATANLTCMATDHAHRPLDVDRVEIAEVRSAPMTTPPQPLGPHATEVLELLGVP